MNEAEQRAAEKATRRESPETEGQLSLWGEAEDPPATVGEPESVEQPSPEFVPSPEQASPGAAPVGSTLFDFAQEQGEECGSGGGAIGTQEPAWTLTDLGAFVLFVFVVSLPAAFLGAAGLFVALREVFGWEMTVTEAYTRAPMIVTMQTGWELLWLLFIYFTIAVKYDGRFWEAMRWKLGNHRPRNWLAGGAALALVAQLYFFASPSEKELPIERLFSNPGAGYVLMAFGILVAPFVEELVFRGFIYPVFEKRWGLWAAVLLTALLFAVIHASQLWGGWKEIAAIFVVGAAFSYTRGRTGSLVPSYLLHLGYNTALFVTMFLSTDGFRTLGG